MSVGIVTGVGRGMGAACATRLIDEVDVLLLVDRDADGATALAETLAAGDHRGVAEPFVADITDAEGLACSARRCASAGGGARIASRD